MIAPQTLKLILQQCTNKLNSNQILTEESNRWSYGYDNSRRQALPDLVLLPESHEQVQFIVALCNEYKVAIIARGRGTGTTGATVPISGGVILSTERMNTVLEVNPQDRYLVTQPGVTNKAVQDKAAEIGFFWPPDPTSSEYCTIGGNLAYNSAGPRTVKYGTPRENVLGLKAVIGTGEEIRTGVFTTKGVVGFDLTRLLIGSEGTLAIITEATLKLTAIQSPIKTFQAFYKTIEDATAAIVAIMSQSITPRVLEFIDKNAINMIRDYSDIELPHDAGALLMIEIDGPVAEQHDSVERFISSASNVGLLNIKTANTQTEAEALWSLRKALSPALRKISPKKINEDVVVPISNLPKLISGLEKLSSKHDIPIVNFGHAGNGNIHVNLLYDPNNEQQTKQVHNCLDEVFNLVLDLKGSLSGEHGIGLEKREYIARELDPVSIRLMHQIKQQFDPNGILNPGKMLPDA
ncbi:D-lactate dehydrogenase [hydrothermal vent metagenome]|uniref:D-lactate dehydrogenase n=1 Tax=hydrothermal vent metagenome TaxID=652676 RepID=A0A3B1ACB3_9ZZZZ